MTNRKLLESDIAQTWDPERFSFKRKPEIVSEIDHKEEFSSPQVSVLDMPIKFPSGEFRIPTENKAIHEIVDKAFRYEQLINPLWERYYVYLTIDQKQVSRGESHRVHGAHFDGMQGLAYPKKLPVCHQYVIANAAPTQFFIQEFDAKNLDEKRQNWFTELEKQIVPDAVMTAEPFTLYLMTAYSMHDSPIVKEDCLRTFCRVEFSLKEFDRDMNTRNPLLPSPWKYRPRPIPEHLLPARQK